MPGGLGGDAHRHQRGDDSPLDGAQQPRPPPRPHQGLFRDECRNRPGGASASTAAAVGLTKARSSATTVGTVSSPSAIVRTRAAADGSAQMSASRAGSPITRRSWRSLEQNGQPGRQQTVTGAIICELMPG